MNNPLFSHVSSDYYTRCYKMNPKRFGGLSVTICALCTENTERINDEYYWLDLYYSIGDVGVLDYLVGVSFGDKKMDQKSVDIEMDELVKHMTTDPGFPAMLQSYLRREQILEDVLGQGEVDETDTHGDDTE